MKFTKTTIAELTLPPGKSEHIEWDSTMPGFGIRLRLHGAPRFVVQYRIGRSRKQRRETLDPRKVPLDAARKIAEQRFAQAKLGQDPVEEARKEAAKTRHTVGHVVGLYLADREPVDRPATTRTKRRHLLVDWKPLHDRPVNEITRRDVADRVRDLKKGGMSKAGGARYALSAMYAWGMREGLVESNPVNGTSDPLADAESRDRTLTDGELAAVWRACGDDDVGRIARLMILTGARPHEIGELERSEVNLDHAILNIPKERTKTHEPLVQTLSRTAIGILQSIPMREDRPDLFFGSEGNAFNNWHKGKRKINDRIKADTGTPIAAWNFQDLRRTVRSRLGKIGISRDIAEMILNHARPAIVKVYDTNDYTQPIAQALRDWEQYVLALVKDREPPANNIVPLRAASA
jgi:integrase